MMEWVKKHCLLVSFIGSFFCTIGLSQNYIIRRGSLFDTNSLVCFITFFLLVAFFRFVILNYKKREILCSILSGLILSVCYRVGTEFSVTKDINFKSLSLYYTILIIFILFTLLIATLLHYKKIIIEMLNKIKIPEKINIIFLGEKSYWYIFGLIIIMWIPAFLAVFPGIYSYDAGPQVLQIFGGQGLSAHHPVIHTLLLDGCFYIGHLVFGNYNVGLMFYTIIQMIIMALCFAYAVNIMKKYKLPIWAEICALLFFGLSPINQVWVLLTTKDTIYAGFLLVLFVETIDIFIDTDAFFSSKYKLIRYVVISVLMCLFRNQGIYIYILLIPFMVFAVKKYRKKVLLIMVVSVIFVKTITGPISSMCGLAPSNPREALSVPIQQIARVMNLKPEVVTEKEKKIIYKYLPEENIAAYNPVTSDFVKEGFNQEYFKKNPKPFFEVWFSLLKNEPTMFIDSFLFGSYGYFYMDESPYWITYILFDGAWLTDEYNILNIKRNSLFPLYEKYLRKVSVDLVQEKIPVLSIILNEAFPFWVCIVALAVLVYNKKWKLLIPLLIVIGFWGTTLLGPLIAIRYAFPIIVCVPTMFMLMIYDDKKEKNNG